MSDPHSCEGYGDPRTGGGRSHPGYHCDMSTPGHGRGRDARGAAHPGLGHVAVMPGPRVPIISVVRFLDRPRASMDDDDDFNREFALSQQGVTPELSAFMRGIKLEHLEFVILAGSSGFPYISICM